MKHLSYETINRYLEGNLTETELFELEEHIHGCIGCRKELDFNKTLFSSLKNSIVIPSPDFSGKVMKKISRSAIFIINFKKLFNPVNLYIFFFSSIVIIYSLFSSVISDKAGKPAQWTESINTYYDKLTESLFLGLEPFRDKLNLLFQKNGLLYLFLGLSFIIVFMLFDKYVVERSGKRKSIGTFLI